MSVSAAQVKELRERTGAGMMECKKALLATSGNLEGAIEELRKRGRASADKKAGRTAAEGVIVIRSSDTHALILEVNSETDFVARDEHFLTLAGSVADTALVHPEVASVADLDNLMLTNDSGQTAEAARQALIARVGENITLRRLARLDAPASRTGTYLHGTRIGVLLEMDGEYPDLARDIAMHIAASRPLVTAPDEVPAAVIEKEREIFMAQAASSGKPQAIMEKMVEGRLRRFLEEVSLLGQPWVRDPDVTVGALLDRHHAKVLRFARFEVGEGIEKTTEDFVEAVMAQAGMGDK